MLKVGHKSIIILVAVFTLCTCIDPYSPKLGAYQSLLVIDALITDANTSYSVKLSKTFKEQNSTPLTVTDATVYITDDEGNSSHLVNKGNGIYKTDSIQFEGVIGRTYILHGASTHQPAFGCWQRLLEDSSRLFLLFRRMAGQEGESSQ